MATTPTPEYLGWKYTDRFTQLPLWFTRSNIFLKLTTNTYKLYCFLTSKADKFSRETPTYSVCDLAERLEIARKYIKPSIFKLAALKLIRPIIKGRRITVIVLYEPPPGFYREQFQRNCMNTPAPLEDSLNSSPLKAKVLNSPSHSEKGDILSHLEGHFVSSSGALRDTQCDKLGQIPEDGNTQSTTSLGEYYTPGEDIDEHNNNGGY